MHPAASTGAAVETSQEALRRAYNALSQHQIEAVARRYGAVHRGDDGVSAPGLDPGRRRTRLSTRPGLISRPNLGGFGKWRSLAAHLLWEQGVGGSNPPFPTRRWGSRHK